MYKMTIPSIEQAPRENINQFQEEQLQHLMGYLQANSAFYRQVFQTYGVDPHSIRTLADLTRLPFTPKEQLQQDNLAFRCVATSQTADYVTTSGTSGDPVLLALTGSDLDRLAYNESLSYQCMGMAAGQTVQLTTTLARRFMAGPAHFLGGPMCGIGVLAVGVGVTEVVLVHVARAESRAHCVL